MKHVLAACNPLDLRASGNAKLVELHQTESASHDETVGRGKRCCSSRHDLCKLNLSQAEITQNVIDTRLDPHPM